MLCSIRNPELKLTSFIPSANILYTRHWFINVEVWPAAVAAKQMVNSRNEFYLSEMAIYMQLYTYITTRRYVYVFIYTCNTQSHATLLIALTRTHTYIHKKYAVCARRCCKFFCQLLWQVSPLLLHVAVLRFFHILLLLRCVKRGRATCNADRWDAGEGMLHSSQPQQQEKCACVEAER